MKPVKYYIPFLFWSITIIILCVLPGSTFESVKTFQHTDKVVHAFLYFFETLFLWVAISFQQPKITASITKFILISIPLALGLIIEFIQHHYISNRYWDIGDVAANVAGIILALLLPMKLKLFAKNTIGKIIHVLP